MLTFPLFEVVSYLRNDMDIFHLEVVHMLLWYFFSVLLISSLSGMSSVVSVVNSYLLVVSDTSV